MEMEPTQAQKAKAQRAQLILYLVMGIFVLLPFVVYWLRRK
jgi:hypothetical protein